MRQRLAVLSLAISSLVVIAFMIPLALLLRNQAENRALSRSETLARAIATALIVDTDTAEGGETTAVLAEKAENVLRVYGAPEEVTVLFAGGEVVGAPVSDTTNTDVAFAEARAFTAFTEGGAEILVPVLSPDTPGQAVFGVVRAFVTEDDLSEGVAAAWAMIGGLGVFLVIVAVVAADRLGRTVVRPVAELSDAALALGGGDLDRRVTPAGPDEIADVGVAFNFLAERLRLLLAEERESVADLSHRLRTPLTAVRLQAETLADREASRGLLNDIDRLEDAVDRLIEEARRPSIESGPAQSDLGAVVRQRATFWKVLADEQQRPVDIHTSGGRLPVGISAQDLGALVDTLLGNVFAHTDPGTGYRIIASPRSDGHSLLVVEDDGKGFEHSAPLERGESGAGSTGLGLDIALRAAQRTGGTLRLGESATGGARVEVTFGPPAK